jgi:hypothetical protein
MLNVQARRCTHGVTILGRSPLISKAVTIYEKGVTNIKCLYNVEETTSALISISRDRLPVRAEIQDHILC